MKRVDIDDVNCVLTPRDYTRETLIGFFVMVIFTAAVIGVVWWNEWNHSFEKAVDKMHREVQR